MKTVQISLNSIDKVKSFVNAITQFEFDFDLVSGRYVIDAKSIMGIFSLDLSKPIELVIHAEDHLDEIMDILKPYIIPPEKQAGFFYSTLMTSVVSIAVFISSSMTSFSFCSECLMTFRFGFVTGCLATNIVQQSSNGRIDVS